MDTQKVGRTKQATQYSDLSVILEVARDMRGQDFNRWHMALKALEQASFDSCAVVSVSHTCEEPTIVPGFAHDFRCKNETHVCRVQPWSVSRYFQVYVTVRGVPRGESMGRYKLTDHAEVDFCGIEEPHDAGRDTLKRIE